MPLIAGYAPEQALTPIILPGTGRGARRDDMIKLRCILVNRTQAGLARNELKNRDK